MLSMPRAYWAARWEHAYRLEQAGLARYQIAARLGCGYLWVTQSILRHHDFVKFGWCGRL